MQHEEIGIVQAGEVEGQPLLSRILRRHGQDAARFIKVERFVEIVSTGEERCRMAIRSHAENDDIEGIADRLGLDGRKRRRILGRGRRLEQRHEIGRLRLVLQQVLRNETVVRTVAFRRHETFVHQRHADIRPVEIVFGKRLKEQLGRRTAGYGDARRTAILRCRIKAFGNLRRKRGCQFGGGVEDVDRFAHRCALNRHRARCDRHARSVRSSRSGPRFRRYNPARPVPDLPSS
ncbi:hypothetical protein D3C72_1593740 [compost metagenome]